MTISLKDIQKAKQSISEVVYQTELTYSRSCTERVGSKVYLKFENEQLTGSFKIRGALNKIANLSDKERARGVIASSAGNHAQGVAHSARQFHIPSYIVMPVNAPVVKVLATQGYGAHVIFHGDIYDEAYQYARDLEKEKNYTFVHPFNDPHIMAGQGTIGLDLYEQCRELDSVVIPVGGGGLISGIAVALKSLNPKIKIYGVQPQNACAMTQLFKKGSLSEFKDVISTMADGVAVKVPDENMYKKYISKYVDDMVTVSEDEIAESIVFLMERAKTIVEGAAALPLAGACKGLKLGEKTCLLLSGGNIDLNVIAKVVDRGLIQSGRRQSYSLIVEDSPGTLGKLADIFAKNRMNILEVHHDRKKENLFIGETCIHFLVESPGDKAADNVVKKFKEIGVKISEEEMQ